jgi:primary-amine oxidase
MHFIITILFVFLCIFLPLHAQNPFMPLTAAEIQLNTKIISAFTQKNIKFVTVSLSEPDKSLIFKGIKIPRRAFSVLYNPDSNKTIQAVVNLETAQVEQWNNIALRQPMVMLEEYDQVAEITKKDERWIQAIKKRGIHNPADCVVDAWAAGPVKGFENERILRGITYLKGNQTNFYGRPIEGLLVLISINRQQIIEFRDLENPLPLPPESIELIPTAAQKNKESISTHTFTIDSSNFLEWKNWSFSFSLHPREGLVLHRVEYNDKGSKRPVIHRLSLSEMVVPYGDTSSGWTWRNAFDAGEYGIGNLTWPMDTLLDAPKGAIFRDAVLADNQGIPRLRPNVIAVYEKDGGLLWKHLDQYSGKNVSARAQELIISSIATIGNYDYALNYIFRQDGSLEVQVQLTGIMLTKGVKDKQFNQHDQYTGHLVAPYLEAPCHQHFFNFRIDIDADGIANSLSEIDAWTPPDSTFENPAGNAIVMDEHPLRYEQESRRTINIEKARIWKISSAGKKNILGYPTGYYLLPQQNSIPYLMPRTITRKRAGFINYHLWCTTYKKDEFYAAGDFPNQSADIQGLPIFTADNESLHATDLVLWYTMGITHLPRNEEYPVMNVHKASFTLIPAGFFDINPAVQSK